MTEFVGRTGALRVYSWPENPRAAALALFARNFATGPKTGQSINDPSGVQIRWNLIDSSASGFTISPGGVTVSIPGDVTALFVNGNTLYIVPLAPSVLPPVTTLNVASVPVFAGGFTTFDLSAPIDGTTTAGAIEDTQISNVDVRITPRTTGVVLVTGTVTVGNSSGSPVTVGVGVQVNDGLVPTPFSDFVPLANGATVTIPFMAEVALPVGTPSFIEILVTGENAVVVGGASSINVQEVSIATG